MSVLLFPFALLSWSQNSRERPCCNIETGNESERERELTWAIADNFRSSVKTDNVESCHCPVTIHCYSCFECRLLRLLRKENSLVNSPLWAEKGVRKTTLSQESNVPRTPTTVSPSLDQSGWVCQITARLWSCSQHPIWSSFSGWRSETEMCANLAQMYFQTKKPSLILKLL